MAEWTIAAVLPAGGGSAFGGQPEADPPPAEKTVKRCYDMYWVYILKSCKDGKNYIGSTSNIEKRFKAHNSGKVRSTKARKPFTLLYKEEFDTVTEARQRENFLKSGQGRNWIKENLS